MLRTVKTVCGVDKMTDMSTTKFAALMVGGILVWAATVATMLPY